MYVCTYFVSFEIVGKILYVICICIEIIGSASAFRFCRLLDDILQK